MTDGRFDVFRSCSANRVADRSLIYAEIEERSGYVSNLLFGDGTLIRADKACRDVAANRYPIFQRSCDNRFEHIDGFLNTHVDVVSIEGLRSRRKHGDPSNAAGDGAFQ